MCAIYGLRRNRHRVQLEHGNAARHRLISLSEQRYRLLNDLTLAGKRVASSPNRHRDCRYSCVLDHSVTDATLSSHDDALHDMGDRSTESKEDPNPSRHRICPEAANTPVTSNSR